MLVSKQLCLLEVVVESFPDCSFQWYHNGILIENGVTTSNNTSTLLKPVFEDMDVGEYTARAENVLGSVTSTAEIKITEEILDGVKPYFIQELQPQKVMDGEVVKMTCQVSYFMRWLFLC